MKKYPFSNKAMKAILAATIALSPVVTTGVFSGGEKVEAAVTTTDALDRIKLIYSHIESKDIFNDAASGLKNDFEASDWNNVLTSGVVEKINTSLVPFNSTLPVEERLEASDLVSKIALLVYEADENNLEQKLLDLKESEVGEAFEAIMEPNDAIDLTLQFLVDAEKKLWDKDFSELLDSLRSGSIDTITAEIRNELIAENPSTYGVLNDSLNQKMGLSLEGLFDIKDNINAELVSKSVITADKLKVLREAFLDAAFAAGNPTTSPGGGGTPPGGGGTPPTDPPTDPENPPGQGGEVVVELPEGAAEVVRENNPSGKVDVVTKVSPEKVQEIVNLITPEKNVIAIKLEKAAEGEEVKANVPGNLFTEAGKKNPNAVVVVKTDGASYKLPASEVKVSELAAKLGVNESEVQIIISVNEVPQEDVKDTVDKNKLNLASKVIEFTVTAVSGDKSQSISTFTTFVEREITGDQEFNADNSVAVKLNEDGTFSAIPTLFDGNTATVKSLTNSKYTIVENDITFPDVNNVNWAEDYIETLASKYIIRGKLDGRYAPADDMTRAEFIVLLVRGLGLPGEEYNGEFRDVKGSEWFNSSGEVMAAVKYGITEGMRDGRFAPGEKITRIQAAAMVSRAMELKFLNYDKSGLDTSKKIKEFKDYNGIAPWARADIEKIYQAGIMSGTSAGKFNPSGLTKRDQMARILGEFLVSAKLMNDTIE